MSLLDLFLADPTDPVERAQAVADIAELRARRGPCDCDRCCTSCPHETWCPALADDGCEECDDDGDYCSACGGGQ